MSVCSFYKSSYEREYGRKSIKKSESESHLVVSDSLQPHGLHIYSPWNSPGQNTGVGGLFPFPGNLPNPGIKPRSPALRADSLPAEPSGKPSIKELGQISCLNYESILGSLCTAQWLLHDRSCETK